MAQYCLFPTEIGACGIAWANGLVTATHLPDENDTATAAHIAARANATQGSAPASVQSSIDAITELLEGKPSASLP